jgi:hypothetical protein
MNIFYLHDDPRIAARAMTNKHVVKMILESAQLLSTAHHVLDKDALIMNKDNIYKPTHKNHPSAIWVRESISNYLWLRDHLLALLDEYAIRYNKKPHDHKTYNVFSNLFYPPLNIPLNNFKKTPMRVAITNLSHVVKDDAITSYRNYYINEKLKLDSTTNDDIKRFYKTLDLLMPTML